MPIARLRQYTKLNYEIRINVNFLQTSSRLLIYWLVILQGMIIVCKDRVITFGKCEDPDLLGHVVLSRDTGRDKSRKRVWRYLKDTGTSYVY